jgi:hypothetical protein
LAVKTEINSSLRALLLLLIVICVQVQNISAQNTTSDSLNYQTALSNSLSLLNHQSDDQSALLNGSIYKRYGYFVKTGSPYFPSENFSPGWVVYDNKLFENLSLLYEDLEKSVVCRIDSVDLKLVNDRISSFYIDGHQFIRLTAESNGKNIPGSNFYEILYNGPSQVLVNTVKTIQEVPTVDEGTTRYIREKKMYLVNNGTQFKIVNSKSDLLQIFEQHEKEIEAFIKKNKLKYNQNTDSLIIKTAAFYDKISLQ